MARKIPLHDTLVLFDAPDSCRAKPRLAGKSGTLISTSGGHGAGTARGLPPPHQSQSLRATAMGIDAGLHQADSEEGPGSSILDPLILLVFLALFCQF